MPTQKFTPVDEQVVQIAMSVIPAIDILMMSQETPLAKLQRKQRAVLAAEARQHWSDVIHPKVREYVRRRPKQGDRWILPV